MVALLNRFMFLPSAYEEDAAEQTYVYKKIDLHSLIHILYYHIEFINNIFHISSSFDFYLSLSSIIHSNQLDLHYRHYIFVRAKDETYLGETTLA